MGETLCRVESGQAGRGRAGRAIRRPSTSRVGVGGAWPGAVVQAAGSRVPGGSSRHSKASRQPRLPAPCPRSRPAVPQRGFASVLCRWNRALGKSCSRGPGSVCVSFFQPQGARGRWSRPSGRPSSALGGLGVGQRRDSQLVVPAGRGALSWASPQNCVRGALLFHFIGQESEAPESACPDHPTSVLGGASSAAHRGGGFGAAAQRVTRRQTRRPARLVGSGRAPIRDAVAAPDPRDLRATGCRRP